MAIFSLRDTNSLKKMMKQLHVPALEITIDRNSNRDIAVYLGKSIPYILCGRKWLVAPFHERQKRLLHELLHVRGLRHDNKARSAGYYSNPSRDTLSKTVYLRLLGKRRNPSFIAEQWHRYTGDGGNI